jgi:alpha-beta hydrolase superfamily lysophospholipase
MGATHPHRTQTWEAASARAVVVLSAGGEPAGHYGLLARRLNEALYSVVAPDPAGTATETRSGFKRGLADLDALIAAQAEDHPGLPVILLGHATGAAAALRSVVERPERLAGLILAGPLAQTPTGRLGSMFHTMGSALLPDAPPMTLDPQEAARDSRTLADWFADPLTRFGPIGASTASMNARRAAALMDGLEAVTLPTLLLWGTMEGLSPSGGAEHLLGALTHAQLTRHSFSDLQYHAILSDAGLDAVLDAILAWLADRA